MPKPELYPIKKLLRLDQQTSDGIQRFREKQSPSLNESQAIRKLIRDQLHATGDLAENKDEDKET